MNSEKWKECLQVLWERDPETWRLLQQIVEENEAIKGVLDKISKQISSVDVPLDVHKEEVEK
jgi:hypothetical protein